MPTPAQDAYDLYILALCIGSEAEIRDCYNDFCKELIAELIAQNPE